MFNITQITDICIATINNKNECIVKVTMKSGYK